MNLERINGDDFESVSEILGFDVMGTIRVGDYLYNGASHFYVHRGDLVMGSGATSAILKDRKPVVRPNGKFPKYNVVVVGNVTVNGELEIEQYYDLYVSGDLKTDRLFGHSANLVVAGSVFASDTILWQTSEEGGVLHTSDCKTPLLIKLGDGSIIDNAGGLSVDGAVFSDPDFENFCKKVRRLTDKQGIEAWEMYGPVREIISAGCSDVLISMHDASASKSVIRVACSAIETSRTEKLRMDAVAAFKEANRASELVEHFFPDENEWRFDREPDRTEKIPKNAVYFAEEYVWRVPKTDSDNRLDGKIVSLDINGNLVYVAEYKTGLLQGEWKKVNKEGLPLQIRNYKDGLLHGVWENYRNDGSIIEQRDYVDGQLAPVEGVPPAATWNEGKSGWIVQTFDEHGLRIEEVYRFPEGTLESRTEFENGVPHGTSERFHNNGEVAKTFSYDRALVDGDFAIFKCSEPSSEVWPRVFHDNVSRMQGVWAHGVFKNRTCFNADGIPVDSQTGEVL